MSVEHEEVFHVSIIQQKYQVLQLQEADEKLYKA